MSDMISREAVASLLMQHAVYRRECARKADEVGHDTWADMNREAAEALLGVLAVIRDLPAVQPDAGAALRGVPKKQTPLNDRLGHYYLDVLNEGSRARDTGAASPYHGHSLEHCLHASGWVSRDLRLALDAAKAQIQALIDNPAVQPEPWNPVTSPGMTDLMVDPDSLDAFMEANPLPAVQPDAGAIRDKVLREVLGNLGGVELFGSTPQDTHAALEQWCRCRDMIYALIDKPGKEVRPDVEDTHHARPDTAPAGLSAGGGADWQPIETAPKDGIAFLGYWPDVADFGEADNACEVRTWWNETEQRYESCFETASSDSEPTHWMPRPSPPSTEGGA
jgi:hypothetical protein